MALLRYKPPTAAPYISRRWPQADAAFSASALAGTRYYDLAKRAWYEFNPNASVGVGRGLPGPSIKPILNSSNGQNRLRDITRDLDTDTCIWTFTFSVDAGAITAAGVGARFELFDGSTTASDVNIVIRSTGLLLRAGSLAADVSILALANLPREKTLTLSVLAGDTDVQVWLNGARLYAGTPSQSWTAQTAVSFSAYVTSGSGSEAFFNLQQAATWTNNVSLDMARRLSLGPQELFEPSYIWVPVGSAGNSYSVSVSESSAAADFQTAIAGWSTSIGETVTATDSATRTIVAVVSTSESASATDTVTTGAASYNVSVTEAGSATDAASAIATLLASASETLAAFDAFTVAGVYGRSVSEAASASDATNWGGAFYSVDIAETASLADAVSAALAALAATSEAGNATDALSVLVTGGTAAVAESAAASDALTTTAQLVAALTEPGSAADLFSASASGDMLGELVEAAAATDAYVVAVVRGIALITVRPATAVTQGAQRPAVLAGSARPTNLSGRGR